MLYDSQRSEDSYVIGFAKVESSSPAKILFRFENVKVSACARTKDTDAHQHTHHVHLADPKTKRLVLYCPKLSSLFFAFRLKTSFAFEFPIVLI